MSLKDCGISFLFYFIEMILVHPAGIPNKQWQWMLLQKYGGKGDLVNPRETHYRVHRKEEKDRKTERRKDRQTERKTERKRFISAGNSLNFSQ